MPDITVNKRINATTSITIRFDNERSLKEGILKATPFMQMSDFCPLCKTEGKTRLQARTAKSKDGSEYLYVEQSCTSCRAKRPFGEHKIPAGALFIKAWEEPYVKGQEKPQTAEPSDVLDNVDAGDVPF